MTVVVWLSSPDEMMTNMRIALSMINWRYPGFRYYSGAHVNERGIRLSTTSAVVFAYLFEPSGYFDAESYVLPLP